jgi:hypothetical protein
LTAWLRTTYDLRTEQQNILAEAAEQTVLKDRMNDMIYFLEAMPTAIMEYREEITRRLIERIAVFDEKIVVELKLGLELEVEA